jgi:anti-sigma regulatory factor (Ser/Thr protein kinase)
MYRSRGSSAVAAWTRPASRLCCLEIVLTPAAVQVARNWTADQLTSSGQPLSMDLVDDAVLLVSELVTNAMAAVMPAGTAPAAGARVRLVITQRDDDVRIEVFDSSPVPLVPSPDPGTQGETGRGLIVVDALAARWGWQPDDFGKVVWCELVS